MKPLQTTERSTIRRAAILIAIGAAMTASGCATLTENECRTADWQALGYRDGVAGYSRSIIASHEKACSKAAIKPDANRWYVGYERGNTEYCSPQHGFEEGLRDNTYRNVCPAHLEPAFLERYAAGHEVFKARRTLADIDSDIDTLEHDLRRTDIKPERRREIHDRLTYQRVMRLYAAQQVATIEASARGVPVVQPMILPPPPPVR